MPASIANIPKNTNVYRFITSGKPGNCKLCGLYVEKLEAHHLCYSPEITIDLGHNCHHKVHFWPQRLNELEKKKLLEIRFDKRTANDMLKKKMLGPLALAQLVAPSRRVAIQKHILKHNKAFKALQIKRIGIKKAK